MELKVGSTAPGQSIECSSGGVPVPVDDLEAATSVTMVGRGPGAQVITDTSPTIGPDAGVVTHEWDAGETDADGRVQWRVDVDFGDGKIVTFPEWGYEVTTITP